MFTFSKVISCGAIICSVLSVAFGATVPTMEGAASKAPGMLISQKGPRGWRLGFVGAAAPSALLRAPAPAISTRKLRAASPKMGMNSNLVTYGDVWRDAIEGKNAEIANTLSAAGMEEMDEVNFEIVDVVRPFTTAASALGEAAVQKGRNFLNSLGEPSAEEVQANLAAFASCHSGAVATPLSEDELETEIKYCAMIPEWRDALVDAEVMEQELNDAILHRQLAAQFKMLRESKPVA